MSGITPELALVDPELAAAARASLPGPGRFRPAWKPEPVLVPETFQPDVVPPLSVPPIPAPPRSRRRVRVAACVAAANLSAAAAFVVAVGGQGQAPSPSVAASPAIRTAAAATLQPETAHPYAWPSVPGAHSYRVTIALGNRVMFRATTSKPTLELPAGLRFRPGRYTWSATPELSGPSAAPARPVVEGTFVVGSS